MDNSRRSFLKNSLGGIVAVAASTMLPSPVMASVKKEKHKKMPHARRVLLLGLDGIRVDGFSQANTPNLDRLLANGSLSMSTRVVMPSIRNPIG